MDQPLEKHQKQEYHSAQEAEEKIRILSSFPAQNPNPIFQMDANGVIVYRNAAAIALLRSMGPMILESIHQMLPDDLYEKVKQTAKTREASKNLEVTLGNRIFSYTVVPVPDSQYVNLYAMDITQIKKAHEFALEAEKTAIRDMIITYQHYISQPLTAAFTHLDMALHRIGESHPDAKTLRSIKSELTRVSLLLKKMRGLEVIERTNYLGETLMINLDGSQNSPDKKEDGEGKPANHSYLQNVGRLTALGELTAALAHQISHPLTAISVYIDTLLLHKTIASSDDLSHKITRIREEVRRLGSNVRMIVDYARIQSTERQPVDVNQTISESLALFKQQLDDHNIACTMTLDKNIPEVSMEKGRIQDVLVNFLVNARDAIELRYQQQPGGQISAFSKLLHEEGAIIAGIMDNGIPVTPNTERKLFDAFFTTKPAGSGTGLGLSVCRDVMTKHNGLVNFVTLKNGAKAFYIALPFRDDTALTDRGQTIELKIATLLNADNKEA